MCDLDAALSKAFVAFFQFMRLPLLCCDFLLLESYFCQYFRDRRSDHLPRPRWPLSGLRRASFLLLYFLIIRPRGHLLITTLALLTFSSPVVRR